MDKTEFLEILRQQLTGEMPSGELYGNLQYYREYIESEIARGKSEEEVLDALGDPRLIAKTLIDADEAAVYGDTYDETYDASARQSYDETRDDSARQSYDETYDDSAQSFYGQDVTQNRYEQSRYSENPYDSQESPFRWLDLSTWYGKLILIAAAGLFLFLLITLVGALIPIVLIVAAVIAVISLFRRH